MRHAECGANSGPPIWSLCVQALALVSSVVIVSGGIPPLVFAADAPVTPGKLTLTTTYASIGIEVGFTGDEDGDATAELEFKKASDVTWRKGLPLWRTADATQRAFYGSGLLLAPGTTYDVRVTVRDPDGVAGTAVVIGSVTTRTDAIPPVAALAVTRYVRADGDDARDGIITATA
jgi:hypothetical protein